MRKVQRSYTKIKKGSAQFIQFFIFISLIFCSFSLLASPVNAGDTSYIPATPEGPDVGFLDIIYNYTIYTTSSDAQWMFDWGDGLYTPWLTVSDGEETIIQSHSWSSAGIYQLRIQFKNDFFKNGVWSNPLPVTISQYEADDFPNTPDSITGKTIICMNVTTAFSTKAIDPDGNKIQFRFDWGDNTTSTWTNLVPSDTFGIAHKKWTHPGEYLIRTQAKDQYGLLSGWSEPYNITVEIDSDQDTLSNAVETHLGSNPSDATDVKKITIDTDQYIITTMSGSLLFYNVTTETTTTITINDDGFYLIDDDNDGVWDYTYNPATHSLSIYVEPEPDRQTIEIPWLFIIIPGIIGGIILVIAALIKKGYIYIYDEYVPEN
jgi:hypothetical protein